MQTNPRPLWMVHQTDLDLNVDETGNWVEGTPRYRVKPGARRFKNDSRGLTTADQATYQRGGILVNVNLSSQASEHELWGTTMLCDGDTCVKCNPGNAGVDPGAPEGMPFVHASDLHKNAPPRAMTTVPGALFWREGSQPLPTNTQVNHYETKLIKIEVPVGGGGILHAAAAVCIPEGCSFCSQIMEQTPSPIPDNDHPMNDADNINTIPSATPAVVGLGEGLYEVRAIVDSLRSTRTRKFQYKVWWRGYPKDEATWEPLDQGIGENHLYISLFHGDYPQADRPSRQEAAEFGIEQFLWRTPPSP